MTEPPVAGPLITLGDPAAADVCVDGWCGPADGRPEPATLSDDAVEDVAPPPVAESSADG